MSEEIAVTYRTEDGGEYVAIGRPSAEQVMRDAVVWLLEHYEAHDVGEAVERQRLYDTLKP